MLDSLLHTGIVQNTLKLSVWVLITGIFFSGALVFLEGRVKGRWLRKSAYFFSFAGLLYLILIILSGSAIIAGTEEQASMRISSINLDASQADPIISRVLESTYVFGCWILLGGSVCSGLLMLIKRRLPRFKVLNVSYFFSLIGPILFIFLVWNKSLVVDDWEVTGLDASWYQKAAEKGNSWAQVELGQCYLEGRGVNKSEEEAFKLFKKAAEQGDVYAQGRLGLCYEEGEGVSQDYKEAVRWYTKAAEQGDEFAQTKLGLSYEEGRGVAQNYKEAVKWYTKAAEQGDTFAQANLGRCYANGAGVAKDDKEAVKWYTKAAEQEDAYGQGLLGHCYLYGKGVVKDEKKAFEWFIRSAEQGNSTGQYLVGKCYLSGTGVAKDEKKAFEWYAKSAEQGNADGQNNLGWLYLKGIGVAKDEKKAFEWYAKSAEQGNAGGQYILGRFYLNGIGVAKDEKLAVIWLSRAADQDDPYGLTSTAWILATSNDPNLRNGKEAAKLAHKAIKIFDKPNPITTSVLAAAYAEQGDFEMAVTTQEKAISILTDQSYLKEFRAELKAYKAKRPWRDDESLNLKTATNPQQKP